MPYRDVEEFAPVSLVSGGPLILAVNPQLPVRTIGELIALAACSCPRSRPATLSLASTKGVRRSSTPRP